MFLSAQIEQRGVVNGQGSGQCPLDTDSYSQEWTVLHIKTNTITFMKISHNSQLGLASFCCWRWCICGNTLFAISAQLSWNSSVSERCKYREPFLKPLDTSYLRALHTAPAISMVQVGDVLTKVKFKGGLCPYTEDGFLYKLRSSGKDRASSLYVCYK